MHFITYIHVEHIYMYVSKYMDKSSNVPLSCLHGELQQFSLHDDLANNKYDCEIV